MRFLSCVLLFAFAIIPSAYRALCMARRLLKDLKGKKVCLVGEGDFSFCRALSMMQICGNLEATTMDSPNFLWKHRAKRNIEESITLNTKINYEVDGTKLHERAKNDVSSKPYDVVLWNFPHVFGKANIKRNRELLQSFLSSAREVTDQVKISLVEGQSGLGAKTLTDWKASWKLAPSAGEAGFLVTHVEPFDIHSFDGYQPSGRRGVELGFHTLAPTMYTLTKGAAGRFDGAQAIESPLYVHELHLMMREVYPNLTNFISQVTDWLSTSAFNHYVHSVHLVDLYPVPSSELDAICHVVQIAYGSREYALSRSQADLFRMEVTSKLPKIFPNVVGVRKKDGRVSQSYPWYVGQALKDNRAPDVYEQRPSGSEDKVGLSRLQKALCGDEQEGRALSSAALPSDDRSDLHRIQAIARSLWTRRVGVLINQ